MTDPSSIAERAAREIYLAIDRCEECFDMPCKKCVAVGAAIISRAIEESRRWIPPGQLPPIGSVLVVHSSYNEPMKGKYVHDLKQWRLEGSNSNMNRAIKAWMPLPSMPSAPPKGDSNG
jgi:hypothetical protein